MTRDPVCNMMVEETPYFTIVEDRRYYFCSQGCQDKFEHSSKDYLANYLFDLVIVGGGPAGLTAGVYASIFRLDTLLIAQSIGGQAVDSSKIKNYMGFDFITGPELKEKFQNQLLHRNYIAHRMATVNKVTRQKDHFELQIQGGGSARTKALIIATGMSRNRLNVPGEEEFQHRGVCYSVVQDAPLFAKKRVLVVGGGNSATQAAAELSAICSDVFLVSRTPLTADPADIERLRKLENLTIYEKFDVNEIGGRESVESVRIQALDGEQELRLPVEGVFIEIGFYPNSGPVAGLVKLNDRGEIKIQRDCSTSVPGIFAAGDVTDAFGKRIIIASGEGSKAAIAAKQFLRK